MGVDYVSFYGVNPLYSERYGKYGGKTEGLSDDMTSVVCEGETMNAVCQGAPCYEREYDAPVFDLTRVCPVAATGTAAPRSTRTTGARAPRARRWTRSRSTPTR